MADAASVSDGSFISAARVVNVSVFRTELPVAGWRDAGLRVASPAASKNENCCHITYNPKAKVFGFWFSLPTVTIDVDFCETFRSTIDKKISHLVAVLDSLRHDVDCTETACNP